MFDFYLELVDNLEIKQWFDFIYNICYVFVLSSFTNLIFLLLIYWMNMKIL